MNLQSIEEFSSTSIPGVKFSLRRMSDADRNRIRQENIEHYERLEDLSEEAQPLRDQFESTDDAETKKDLRKQLRPLDREFVRINAEHIDPAYFKHCFVSTTLTWNGTPVTAENISACSTQQFFQEVWAKIRSFSILGAVETKNFELPITSNEPAQ